MKDRFVDHEELRIFGKVFLHGSRNKFSTRLPWEPQPVIPEGTDWDYAAQHKQPWQQFVQEIEAAGWKECVDKSYMDNDTAFVFEKSIDGEKVQVSLRQNLNRYIDCCSIIDSDFYFKYLWKGADSVLPVEDRRKFFNTMYCLWDR